MVTVKINIEKKHLYIFSAIIGVVLGLLVVNAYNPSGFGGTPSTFGHSIDEVDWNTPIVETTINEPALSISRDFSLIRVMRLYSNLGPGGYNPITQAGDVGLIFTGGASGSIDTGNLVIAPWASSIGGIRINSLGRVGIGVSSPQATLDVGGDIIANGRIFSKNNCKEITPPEGNDGIAGFQIGSILVPSECMNNECTLLMQSSAGYAITRYKQRDNIESGEFSNIHIWSTSDIYITDLTFSPVPSDADGRIGRNGDSIDTLFLGFAGGGTYVKLYDDFGGVEVENNEWTWESVGTDFGLHVCM